MQKIILAIVSAMFVTFAANAQVFETDDGEPKMEVSPQAKQRQEEDRRSQAEAVQRRQEEERWNQAEAGQRHQEEERRNQAEAGQQRQEEERRTQAEAERQRQEKEKRKQEEAQNMQWDESSLTSQADQSKSRTSSEQKRLKAKRQLERDLMRFEEQTKIEKEKRRVQKELQRFEERTQLEKDKKQLDEHRALERELRRIEEQQRRLEEEQIEAEKRKRLEEEFHVLKRKQYLEEQQTEIISDTLSPGNQEEKAKKKQEARIELPPMKAKREKEAFMKKHNISEKKATQEIEALEAGADVILEQPLKPATLNAHIKSLLRRQDLSSGHVLEDDDMMFPAEDTGVVSEEDRLFFDALGRVIRENAANPNLTVPVLCEMLHVSRTKLYNKIRKIIFRIMFFIFIIWFYSFISFFYINLRYYRSHNLPPS